MHEHQFLSLASLEQGPHRDAVVPKVCGVRGLLAAITCKAYSSIGMQEYGQGEGT